MRIGRTWTLGVALCAAMTFFPRTSAAGGEPTKDQCVDANTKAQTLRRASKLRDARAELLICGAGKLPRDRPG